jgi:hypothetical protein
MKRFALQTWVINPKRDHDLYDPDLVEFLRSYYLLNRVREMFGFSMNCSNVCGDDSIIFSDTAKTGTTHTNK